MKPFRLALLTALASRELHGYGLYQQMQSDAQGHFAIRDWAVYRELPQLFQKGLVENVPATAPQRYRLTPFGRRLLKSEQSHALRTYQLLHQRL